MEENCSVSRRLGSVGRRWRTATLGCKITANTSSGVGMSRRSFHGSSTRPWRVSDIADGNNCHIHMQYAI